MTLYHILTLKRPAQGEEPEKEWGRGRYKGREEKCTKAKEAKSFKMWVVLICVNASEKSSKDRMDPFNLAKNRMRPWKGSLSGLLQVEFRLQCEKE